MACIIAVDKNADCNVTGGVYQAYLITNKSITDVSFDASGHLTGFTLGASAEIVKFNTFEDDNSAYYNQTKVDGKNEWTQEGYMKFNKITAAKVEAANAAAGCCEGYTIVWFLNDGSVLVQGLDFFKTTSKWKFTKERALINPNVLSNTGADKSYMDYKVASVSQSLIPVDATKVTEEYMDAL